MLQNLALTKFIADFIESNPIFREDRVCQELIVEALKYHLLPERRSTLQSSRTRPRKSTVRQMRKNVCLRCLANRSVS